MRKYARQHCVYAIAGFVTEIKSLGLFTNFEIKLKSLEFLRATAHTRNRCGAFKTNFYNKSKFLFISKIFTKFVSK